MNTNQYIPNASVICHSGVKGMKWGKHLKAAQDSVNQWINDERNKHYGEPGTPHTAEEYFKTHKSTVTTGTPFKGSYEDYVNTHKNDASWKLASAGQSIKNYVDKNITGKSAKSERDQARKDAEYNRGFSAFNNQTRQMVKSGVAKQGAAQRQQGYANLASANDAKAASANKRYEQSFAGKANKAYRVVKTKAGQLFGKPILTVNKRTRIATSAMPAGTNITTKEQIWPRKRNK